MVAFSGSNCLSCGAHLTAALFDVELLAQAGFVFRAELFLAGFTGFLMPLTAGLIRGLAAIDWRHFLVHALAEGGTGLAVAFLVGYLA
jgi:hypothetical protein